MMTKTTPETEVERLLRALLPDTVLARHCYVVGGYVRDQLMGLESKDLDLVVDLPGGAQELVRQLHSLFPGQTTRPRQMGAHYPIWHIGFKRDVYFRDKTYGTATAELDVADTQQESFPDETSRQRCTTFGTLQQDAQRRDFTVNQLMRCCTTGKTADPSGRGRQDIRDGILRCHPDVDPRQVFRDDPLRMLRLVRFMCRYSWDTTAEVKQAVAEEAKRINIVSAERIQEELVKMIQTGQFVQAVCALQAMGLLRHILPEVDILTTVDQGTRHHSEGSAFQHTMLLLEKVDPTVVACWAALLHDTGKAHTREQDGDHVHFYGHEEKSGEIAQTVMERLRFDNETTDKVVFVVSNHMRAHHSRAWKPRAVRKFVREMGDNLEAVLHQTEHDSQSSYGADGVPKENIIPLLRKRIEEQLVIPIQQKPILGGTTIMEILGCSPGPRIGAAQRWLQEHVDQAAALGHEASVEEATVWLREEYSEESS